MTAAEKLQKRLRDLPPDQREAVAMQLLHEMEALEWDAQIEADASSGKLDDLARRAEADIEAGRISPL